MSKPKVGDKVTCKFEEQAYYSGYGGQSEASLKPGDEAVVAAIAPKVSLPQKGAQLPPGIDRCSHFAVVDFVTSSGERRRTGLNFANVSILWRAERGK